MTERRSAENGETHGDPRRRKDFGKVYELEFDYVCASLRRLGVRPADLDDVAQDVFLAVYRHLDDYDGGRPLKPWLFGFAVRAAANYRRLARHALEHAVAMETRSKVATPEEQAGEREDQDAFSRALEEIEIDKRAILILHDLDGVAVPEIVQVLGGNLNTVYSKLRLARRDLIRAVRRHRGEGES